MPNMPKKLILGFILTLTAMTGLAAAPAKADNAEEIGRLIVGAATLFVIGNILSDRPSEAWALPSAQEARPVEYNRKKEALIDSVHREWRKGSDRNWSRKTLPMECFFSINSDDHGHYKRLGVFGQNCLSEFLQRTDHLPNKCKMRIAAGHHRVATVYRATCLQDHGFAAIRQEVRRR